ncbi:unnamed protein product, partial [marine sediment metagenome]
VRDFLKEHDFKEVRFVLFSDGDLKAYEEVWQKVSGE